MPDAGSAQTPEQLSRRKIDALLTTAGWVLQNANEFNRNASAGVAVREFQLPSGPCDYLLFVGGKAAGVIEAKKAGTTLSAVSEQSDRYMAILRIIWLDGPTPFFSITSLTARKSCSRTCAIPSLVHDVCSPFTSLKRSWTG
jgi:type I site-specific restriction endonuclease